MYKKAIYTLRSNERLTPAVWRMTLEGDTQWITAPGQFVNVELDGCYLRRPISVCDMDEAAGRLTLVYKVVGEGTAQMRDMVPGQTLDLLTGLGNGYNLSVSGEHPLLLGGGVALGLRFYSGIARDPMRAFTEPSPSPSPLQAGQPLPSPTLSPEEQLLRQADTDFMRSRVNILLVGWDQSPERDDSDSVMYRDSKNNFRSDVLMLLAVDFEQGNAHLISIPRDTMAKIYNTKGITR